MIAKMAKYDFVLYAAQSEDFIEKLRELGLVDITTTGWEPSEEDRQLLLDIEGHAKAFEFLRNFRTEEGRCKAGAEPFATGRRGLRTLCRGASAGDGAARRDRPSRKNGRRTASVGRILA